MNTQEEFDAAESHWRAQLTGRSLVIEASADPHEAEKALGILGANYRRATSRDAKTKFLLKYQASFLVGVCSAAFHYDVHGMWPYLERIFGPLPQTDQQILSEAFRRSLDDFGLSRFYFPRRNVDEILMHAGIPGQRMDEFIELLARRDAMMDGLDGRSFCQWVGSLSRATAFTTHRLDAPTFRFLAEGREIAEDLVDRCLELLDVWTRAVVTDADVAGFPGVMQKDLLRALDELSKKRIARRSKPRSRQLDLIPKLLFNPNAGLSVRLPPIESVTDTTVEWIISAEGSTTRKIVEPPWPGDPIRTEYFPVSRPCKQMALTAAPGDRTWIVKVVDPEDPLLVFDGATGEWIPPRNTLPKSEVWIAVANPEGLQLHELVELDAPVAPRVIDGPMGWSGWTFALLSLAPVSKLRVQGAVSWRYVSSIQRPTIEPQGLLELAHAPNGSPIWTELPTITLPGVTDRAGSGASIEWVVSMSRTSDGELVQDVTVRGGSESQRVELDLAGPIIGEFDFVVKGPLGRGTSRRIQILNGFQVKSDLSFRAMSESGDGLVPASISIAGPPGAAVFETFELAASQNSNTVTVGGPPGFTFIVEVPSMAVAKVSRGGQVVTSRSPIAIDLEELDDTQLKVTLGNPGRSQLVAMKGDRLLQTVTAVATGPHSTASFNLAQFTATLAAAAGGSLFVGSEGSRVPVGTVRPRQLVESIELDDNDEKRMRLIGAQTDQTLEVAFYPRYAPWKGPQIARSTGDCVVVPSGMDGEGAARVVLRVADQWVRYEWPRKYPPRSFNVFDISLGELTDSRGGTDQGFRSWLRQLSACPEDPSSLPIALGLYFGKDLKRYNAPEQLREELLRSISKNRDHVPAAYPLAAIESAPLDLFVAADVATLPPAAYPHGAALWESSALLAVLANTNSLESVSDDLDRVLGESANGVLTEGVDPFASLGRFGPNEEFIARWPQDRIETVWRSVSPIPGRLLDAETRVIAAKQMFDRRARISFDTRSAGQLLATAQQFLDRAFGGDALAPVRARAGSPGWASLPAMTIAFALVARSRARKVEGANALHQLTKPYLAALAQMSSKLVEQDLILAELWLTRWSAE